MKIWLKSAWNYLDISIESNSACLWLNNWNIIQVNGQQGPMFPLWLDKSLIWRFWRRPRRHWALWNRLFHEIERILEHFWPSERKFYWKIRKKKKLKIFLKIWKNLLVQMPTDHTVRWVSRMNRFWFPLFKGDCFLISSYDFEETLQHPKTVSFHVRRVNAIRVTINPNSTFFLGSFCYAQNCNITKKSWTTSVHYNTLAAE